MLRSVNSSSLVALSVVVLSMATTPAHAALLQYQKFDGNGTAAVGTNGAAGGVGGAPSAAADRNGNPGGAVQFTAAANDASNGTEDGNYYSLAGGGGINNASLGTLSFWVRWDGSGIQDESTSLPTPYYGAVMGRNLISVFSGPTIGLSNANPNSAVLRFTPGSSAFSNTTNGVTTVGANTWRHIALAYSPGTGSTNNYQLYMDGVLQINLTNDNRFVDNSSIPLSLGAWIASGDSYSTSRLDDFGVFTQHLNAAHVSAIGSLGTFANLQYDLDNTSDLFDLYAATTGEVTIDGLTWNYGTGLSTGLGQVSFDGQQYFLQLGGDGTGLLTQFVPPVPEPSSALLLFGLIALFPPRRKNRD